MTDQPRRFRLRYLKRPGAVFSTLGASMVAFHLTITLWGQPIDLTPWGFVVMLGGSSLWLAVGFLTGDRAVQSLWGYYTVLNIVGFVRWFW